LRCTGREYAAADARWGTADPTVVSLELLTVFGAGPLAALIVYQIVKRDPARHYWIVVLSTAELYGGYAFFVYSNFFWWGTEPRNEIPGTRMMMVVVMVMAMTGSADPLSSFYDSWMTFCPEWLTGSPSLDTSNALFLWVYLVVSFFLSLLDVTRINLFFCSVVHEHHVCPILSHPTLFSLRR
jgi:EXPERA (EXPanded EBP superfamily)